MEHHRKRDRMNPRVIGVVVAAALVVGLLVGYGIFGGPASAAPQGPTDLVVGTAYQVADFKVCLLANGMPATEWHFDGADRSRRNQLTPELDGRGRRIFRVVANDPSLPAGYMRLRHVEETDPVLEGFRYGTYSWGGILVEYNGPVEAQRRPLPTCGPAR